MAYSETDVQKQIRHMVGFIEQEALEKIEEIEAKAEEDYRTEKERLIEVECAQIKEMYDRKEMEHHVEMRVHTSQMINQSRMCLLRVRDDHVYRVLEEAAIRLASITQDRPKYKELLGKLILQALYQIMEPKMTIQCREEDKDLVQELIPEITEAYNEQADHDLDLSVGNKYLDEDITGGVKVEARHGTIKVVNTLESRLRIISEQLVPQIRAALFGSNPNRKYLE